MLIHCAGPFTHTGEAVARAAIDGGCHYVDHGLEQHHTRWFFDALPEPAARAGVVMVTAMSFYGGMGDLLAGAAAAGMTGIERVIAAYAVSGWRLTAGAKATAELLFADTRRITYEDGAERIGYVEPRNAVFPFPPPLGPRTMIAPVPFPEVVTVPRHVRTRRVEAQLTAHTFQEEHVFTSEHVDDATRAGSEFTVAVQVINEHGNQAAWVSGRDLWRLSAVASVEAAIRIADGRGPGRPGVYSPAEAFAPGPFLRDLERLGLARSSSRRRRWHGDDPRHRRGRRVAGCDRAAGSRGCRPLRRPAAGDARRVRRRRTHRWRRPRPWSPRQAGVRRPAGLHRGEHPPCFRSMRHGRLNIETTGECLLFPIRYTGAQTECHSDRRAATRPDPPLHNAFSLVNAVSPRPADDHGTGPAAGPAYRAEAAQSAGGRNLFRTAKALWRPHFESRIVA